MGSQTSFYMLAEDEAALLKALGAKADVVLVSGRNETDEPRLVRDFPEQGTPLAREGTVLWNRSITRRLVFKKLSSDYFILDKNRSEVIEFCQCEPIGNTLRRGRIWAKLEWDDEDFRRFPKSEAFVKWYQSVARWIRTHSEGRTNFSYVFRAANVWADAGGQLQ